MCVKHFCRLSSNPPPLLNVNAEKGCDVVMETLEVTEEENLDDNEHCKGTQIKDGGRSNATTDIDLR